MEGAGPPNLGGRTVEQSSLEPVDDRDRKPRRIKGGSEKEGDRSIQ